MRVFSERASDLLSQVSNLTPACLQMTGVFSNLTPACLLTQASNLTPACLLSQVSNLTPACLLSQVSNLTPACLLTQPSNLTPACLLTQASNLTPACLLTQASNLTAACLITTLGDRFCQDATVCITAAATALNAGTVRNAITLSKFNISVTNPCDANLIARLQISPDNVAYSNDTATVQVTQNQTQIFVPSRFAKYARIQYAAQTAGCTVTFNEFFQGQV